MTDLVLLRHGRTDWNAVRRIQGQSDSQLDELGHAQAAAVAPVIAAMQPAALWSSDSARARATAGYLAPACGLEPTYDARLREYHLGPREGMTHQEYAADSPEEFGQFFRGHYDAVVGAERSEAVAARMRAALEELAAAVGPTGLGVAVTHGSAIRTTVTTMLGWPTGHEHALRGLENCGWTVLRRRPEVDEHWRLVAYNRVAGPGAD